MKITHYYQAARKYFLWGLPLLLVLVISANKIYEPRRVEGWINFPQFYLPYSIGIDSSGNIWVGDSKGVHIFDGKEWSTAENSGRPNTGVQDFSFDASGNVWMATYKGAVVFDGEEWIIYTLEDLGLQPSDNLNSIIYAPSGNIWVGSLGGVSVFDGEEWTSYTPPGPGNSLVYDLEIDPLGNIWRCTGLGVSKFDGKEWTIVYTRPDGSLVHEIVFDLSGNAWLITKDGVSVFNGEEQIASYTNHKLGIPSGIRISEIVFDPSGNAWMITNYSVIVFDGEKPVIYTADNSGLYVLGVSNIVFDLSGNAWLQGDKLSMIRDGANGIGPVSPPILTTLRNAFFSPDTIWFTCAYLIILWISIKTNNLPASVSVAVWVFALIIGMDNFILLLPLTIISFFGTAGALIGRKFPVSKGKIKDPALRGMFIGFGVALPFGCFVLWAFSQLGV